MVCKTMDREVTRFRWVSIFGGVLMVSFLSYCMEYTIQIAHTSILSTLATIQTTIFAIVFSVLILGVQLSASRYSPRLVSIFTSDIDYKHTVLVFATSIGYNITLIYIHRIFDEYILMILVILSGGLAVGAFWTLYEFVDNTLKKTTPEGIIDQLDAQLTPQSVVEDARTAADDITVSDPFLPLISVIRSVIQDNDRATAANGLKILGANTRNLLASVSSDEFESETSIDQSLRNVWVNQIPGIIEEALEGELTQIAIAASEQADKAGQTAIEEELERPLELIVEGQTELIDEIGYGHNGERVRREVIDTSRNLLRQAAKEQLWHTCAIGTRRLGWISAASIMGRDQGKTRDERYTSLLILYFPKLLNHVVEANKRLTDYNITAWLRNKHDDVDPIDLLVSSSYDSMAELTSAALRFELRTEQSIVRWDQVAYGWTDGFHQLLETDVSNITQQWFGTILYLEYLQDMGPQGFMEGFDPHAKFIDDSDFVRETITRILDGDIDPRKCVDFVPGGIDPIEMPRTGRRIPPVIDPEDSFEDWLERERHMYESVHGGWDVADKLDENDEK